MIDTLWKAGEHLHSSALINGIFWNPRVFYSLHNAHISIYFNILFLRRVSCKGIRLCVPAAGMQSSLIPAPSDRLSGSRVAAAELIPAHLTDRRSDLPAIRGESR